MYDKNFKEIFQNFVTGANAAAYLQHLTYNNSDNKTLVRQAGGIVALVSVLENRRASDRVIEHAAGALRNASYGCNENKIAIKDCEGISALLKILRQRRASMSTFIQRNMKMIFSKKYFSSSSCDWSTLESIFAPSFETTTFGPSSE